MKAILLIAAACLAAATAAAQTNFGQINGTVTDPSGVEIAGAKVVLQSLETSNERQAVTNANGTYVIPSVAPGRYSLTVTAAGFHPNQKRRRGERLPSFGASLCQTRSSKSAARSGTARQSTELSTRCSVW